MPKPTPFSLSVYRQLSEDPRFIQVAITDPIHRTAHNAPPAFNCTLDELPGHLKTAAEAFTADHGQVVAFAYVHPSAARAPSGWKAFDAQHRNRVIVGEFRKEGVPA
jgi:hypothetical protein